MDDNPRDREDLANQLRNFADRVEDGELAIVEISMRYSSPPRVTIEGMNAQELERLHTYFR